jgi:valyl-tRNA synthetase
MENSTVTLPELPKAYEPKDTEARWYDAWVQRGYFHADVTQTGDAFSIVIPPPNVTGSLHIGHAFNNTLQDILIRWRRMDGHNTLWLPGTDHAGIATQYVVERLLAAAGLDRRTIGRVAFIQRVWAWKEESGGTIIHQLKRLGASCDWARERFTMDAGLSAAVREVFVRLYEEGYIYKGNYIVHWCPRCLTALSDLEVEYEDTPGKLYHIRYPLKTVPRLDCRHDTP